MTTTREQVAKIKLLTAKVDGEKHEGFKKNIAGTMKFLLVKKDL